MSATTQTPAADQFNTVQSDGAPSDDVAAAFAAAGPDEMVVGGPNGPVILPVPSNYKPDSTP